MMIIHNIPLVATSDYDQKTYGIRYHSQYVYRVAGSASPTRIVVWDNTVRPNARDGQSVRYGNYGPIDGGNGRYLDPHHNATDVPFSFLVSPEASVISAHGDGTGSKASGQVYAPTSESLRTGDELILTLPNGGAFSVRVRMTNNGHGVAELPE